VQVVGLSGATAIDAGKFHTCAIVDGAAKCWGENGNGALGNKGSFSSHVPVQVYGLTSGVTAISAGGGHSCAITSTGIQCWGYNIHGQVGDATKTDWTITSPTHVGWPFS
jgi:alpha-tubulin suppressor-like RCC1 family protein